MLSPIIDYHTDVFAIFLKFKSDLALVLLWSLHLYYAMCVIFWWSSHIIIKSIVGMMS